jgi:hypothetical protein
LMWVLEISTKEQPQFGMKYECEEGAWMHVTISALFDSGISNTVLCFKKGNSTNVTKRKYFCSFSRRAQPLK